MKYIILSAVSILLSFSTSQASLIQYYAFDGDTTATVGADGVLTGPAAFYAGGGVNGDAVRLNVGSYLTTPLNGVTADAFSVTYFARTQNSSWRNWWSVSANGTSGIVRAETNNAGGSQGGTIDLYSQAGAVSWNGPDIPVAWKAQLGSAWKHHAYVFDGTEVRVYVDGALDDTYAIWNRTDALTTLRVNSSWQYVGGIDADYDEFAVFNEALSVDQVAQLAAGADPRNVVIPEPTSAKLLGLAGLALLLRRRF